MKTTTNLLLTVLILTYTSCTTHNPRKVYSKPVKHTKPISRLELRQQKILKCTTEFLRQGVDFEVAVKGCKDDIYYK